MEGATGASPDTNNGGRPHHGYRSALHGSVTVNNPAITRLLLERGANPNDGESLYQPAEHRDSECLRLLLDNGAAVAGTWALDVAVGRDDAGGVRLLLDAAAAENSDQLLGLVTGLLARGSATASVPVVQALLAAGADPAKLDPDGLSPLRRAVRAGRDQVAAALRRVGAPEDATTIDRFIGAGAGGDRAAAERLLTEQPQTESAAMTTAPTRRTPPCNSARVKTHGSVTPPYADRAEPAGPPRL